MLQKQLQILLLLVHRIAFCQSDVKCDSVYKYFESLRSSAEQRGLLFMFLMVLPVTFGKKKCN